MFRSILNIWSCVSASLSLNLIFNETICSTLSELPEAKVLRAKTLSLNLLRKSSEISRQENTTQG